MLDKLGNPLKVGDLVCWPVAQMQIGSLRFGRITAFEPAAYPPHSVTPGLLTIEKRRVNRYDKKTAKRGPSEVVLVTEPKEASSNERSARQLQGQRQGLLREVRGDHQQRG